MARHTVGFARSSTFKHAVGRLRYTISPQTTPEQTTFCEFVERINARDPERLADLMTDAHRFTDSNGHVVEGKLVMLEGWREYFAWFPDYHILIDLAVQDGHSVLACGRASATYRDGGAFDLPAAFRAVIRDGLVEEWQVYCDTREPYELINRSLREE